MFLLELWNGAVSGEPDFRLSTQYVPLTHPWDEGLIDITGMNYVIDQPHGGMIRSQYGTFTVLPSVVAEDYVSVRIYYTNSTEENASLLFEGVAITQSRTRTVCTYDLFSDAPNVRIGDDNVDFSLGSYPGGGDWDLIRVFESYCDYFGWTLVSDKAQAITVDFVATDPNTLFADLLSALASSLSHYFVIDALNTTIHLRAIDQGVVSKSPIVLTAFDYAPSKYGYYIKCAKVTVGDSVAYGSPYYFGQQLAFDCFYESNASPCLTAAEDIRDFYNVTSPYDFEIHMPMEYFVEKGLNLVTDNMITWNEDTVPFPGGGNTFQMVIQGISFNVSQNLVILTGAVS